MRYADDLAYVHHTGFADLARGASPFLVRALAARGLKHATVLELGCGSGILLRALTDAGHAATGVDLSPAMLRIARRTAPRARLVRSSLYDAPLAPCDAVFCVGEPFNYLEPTGRTPPLAPFFRRVASALRAGGLFVFDVIVARPGPGLTRRGWSAGKDWAVLVDTREDARRRRLTRDVTAFVRRNGAWARSREVHGVRVFRTAELAGLLRSAGFRVRVTSRYGTHALAVRRRAFICTRR